MEPGRELDVLVLRRVFGVATVYHDDLDAERRWPMYIPSGKPWRTHRGDARGVPRFSTNIAAAWQIVQHGRSQLGWSCIVLDLVDFWACHIDVPDRAARVSARGVDAPHAICLAALAVVGTPAEPSA